jgi:hypothetical protein
MDRFDVVAVRVEGKSSVVARMVGALSGRAIVAPASAEGRRVEGVNALAFQAKDRETGPSALSIHSSSQAKCSGLSEVKSWPKACRTAR